MFKEGKVNKKGQVTFFVILAILIIVAGVLVFQFTPGVKETQSVIKNPNTYMQDCLEDDIIFTMEEIGMNGGFFSPENFYEKKDIKISYLCYTSEYNKYCLTQVPFLRDTVEEELFNEIEPKIEGCFNSLNKEFTSQGYEVKIKRGRDELEVMPYEIIVTSDTDVTIVKGDSVTVVDSVSVNVNSNMYQLLNIASKIVEEESTVDDVDTMKYAYKYRDVIIDRSKESDGTKIYMLTDKKTWEVFQFASRSLAYPQGFT